MDELLLLGLSLFLVLADTRGGRLIGRATGDVDIINVPDGGHLIFRADGGWATIVWDAGSRVVPVPDGPEESAGWAPIVLRADGGFWRVPVDPSPGF